MDTVNLSNKKLNRRSEYNNLDHLYCHTNDSVSYVRPKNSGSDMDMVSVLKEIKQLKSTISLHLDLIQDQSDQLMSKDKMLMILKKENELLKARIDKLERRNKANNKKDESPIVVEQLRADLPEINTQQNMLKKMALTSKVFNKCTIKLNALEDVLQLVNIEPPTADAEIDNSSSNVSNTGDTDASVSDITTNNNNTPKNGDSIIGTLDGKPISKIVLQRVVVDEETTIKSEKIDDPEVINVDDPVNIKFETLSPTHSQLQEEPIQELSNSYVDKSINSPEVSTETNKASPDVVVPANENDFSDVVSANESVSTDVVVLDEENVSSNVVVSNENVSFDIIVLSTEDDVVASAMENVVLAKESSSSGVCGRNYRKNGKKGQKFFIKKSFSKKLLTAFRL